MSNFKNAVVGGYTNRKRVIMLEPVRTLGIIRLALEIIELQNAIDRRWKKIIREELK
jgi:hypothetical protein